MKKSVLMAAVIAGLVGGASLAQADEHSADHGKTTEAGKEHSCGGKDGCDKKHHAGKSASAKKKMKKEMKETAKATDPTTAAPAAPNTDTQKQ